jgi:hypothetical protein
VWINTWNKHLYQHVHGINEERKNLHYDKLAAQVSKARKTGDWTKANVLSQQAQCLSSTVPNDPNYRHFCGTCVMVYDFLFGLAGHKNEAIKPKHKGAQALNNNLKLELNAMYKNL